ncbi:MAG: hypothetical protein ACLRT4_08275 [Thomasclavelia sp.]
METKWIGINTKVDEVEFEHEKVIRVVKNEKIDEYDENTYAKLTDVKLKNGVIEVKVLSRLLIDAPDFARGFIGIAFRINEDDSYFESFYVRPTNGRIDDPIRKNRAYQYFAYPQYTFAYFREQGITDYEGPANIGLNEWIILKAVIENTKGEFYINDKLVLTVDQMIHDPSSGQIGIFVDTGTEGFFKDLKIINYD